MMDHTREVLPGSRAQFRKYRLNPAQTVKLDMMMARRYSDDADIQRGALSEPRNHVRPGSRDDAIHCSSAGITAVL